MSDYNISAEITANTKGFESGVKKAQTASQKLGKSITNVIKGFGKGGLTGALTSAGLALGGIGIAVGATVKAVKGLVKVLDECSEAYKVQLNAERALDTAINNSPYVKGSASKSLKEFASEMQKVSNMGDEELIPFMTQLIASGRTEAETMKIIKTASDMASSGAMSFDTAVTQLNATLNGNVGRLGQQNAELKALSEEELKNGKAVDILAEKYKGLTEATVDTKKQLKNAIGDLKESFGKSFEDAMTPMRKFFTELVQGWADARKARQEYEGAEKAVKGGTATNEQLIIYYEQQLKYIADEKKMYEGMYGADLEYAQAHLKELELEENKYKSLVATIKYKIKLEEEGTQVNKDAEDREQKIADLKDAYLKKIAEQEARWQNIKDVTGETVKAEEKIKFYEDSLVDLMTEAGGEITTNNQLFKDQMAIINRLTEGLENQKKALADIAGWESKLRQQEIDRLNSVNKETVDYTTKRNNLAQIFNLNLKNLEAQKEADLKSVEDTENAEEAKAKIVEYYNNEKIALQKEYNTEIADITAQEEAEIWEAQKGQYTKMFKTVLSYAEKVESTFKKMATAISKAITSIFNKMANATKSVFQKIFSGNMNDLLDSLLKFEDHILTFFVETLPQLPQFFKSAMSSVSILLENVLQIVTPERIGGIITDIMKIVADYAPQIIGMIAEVVENMIDGIIDSLPQILDTMNVLAEKLAEVLPDIIQKIIDLFIGILKQPEKVAQFVVTLIKMVVEIFNVLIKNIGPLLEALLPAIAQIIWEIIKALPNILKSTAKAMGEGIKGVGKAIGGFFKDLFTGKLFASGTDNAPKGLAIVGEAGPELVNFRGGEQVLSNRNTQKALAGVGNSNTFNVTFNNLQDTSAFAMMQQLKAYNRQMSINGVI